MPSRNQAGCSCCGSIAGRVLGSCANPVPNADVTIKVHSSGAVLATFTTSSLGTYSGPISLPSNPTVIRVEVSAPSPWTGRFNAYSATYTVSSGIAANIGDHQLTVATGFYSWGARWYPLPGTLQFTDSVFGGPWAMPLFNLAGCQSEWRVLRLLDYPGCPTFGGGCAAVNFTQDGLVSRGYSFNNVAVGSFPPGIKCTFRTQPVGNVCPARAFSSTLDGQDANVGPMTIVNDDPLLLTWTGSPGGAWYCGGSVTFTVTE